MNQVRRRSRNRGDVALKSGGGDTETWWMAEWERGTYLLVVY